MHEQKERLVKEAPGWTLYENGRCPLCGTLNAVFWYTGIQGLRHFKGWCPACTNVEVTQDAIQETLRQEKTFLLSAFLRKLPAEEWTNVGTVSARNVDGVLSQVRMPDILEQFDLALNVICDMVREPGAPSQFNYETDWPLLVTQSADSAFYIVKELAREDYLESGIQGPFLPPRPTWKAYRRIEELRSSGGISQVAFVAMSFATDRLSIWRDVIEPAITDAGYKAVRVDQYEHNHRIDDEIIAQIKRCRFLVADFTGQKAGVYFEAGLALGLGRNVIWMCDESDKEKLHFDIRQFNNILYGEDRQSAKKRLENRIVALEGQGNFKLPEK